MKGNLFMKICVCENYEEMSKVAADMIADVVENKPDCVLGLATGDTPKGMYKVLVEKCAAGALDFSRVKSVNLDEYYPISPDNDQSYRYFMNNQLFNHINIDPKNTAVPDGAAKDPEESCRAYEAHIDSLGGIDIQVLGIGRNGHVGFNEPADELHANTHLTALTEDTIDANSRFFENEADVPRHAITMGIGSIFKAKKVIIRANGEGKAEAIRATICGGINPHVPASLLQLHPDVTVICDTKAYSLVK